MEVDRNLFEQLVFDVQRNKQTNGSKEYGFFFCSSRPRISKRKRAVEMIMDSLDSTQSVRSLTLSQGSPTRASRWMDGWMDGRDGRGELDQTTSTTTTGWSEVAQETEKKNVVTQRPLRGSVPCVSLSYIMM